MSRLSTDGRTDGQRNVKIELEFWKQNLQYTAAMGAFDIRLLSAFDLQFRCNLASSLFWFDPKSNLIKTQIRKKIYKKSIKTRTDSSKNGRLSIYRLKILSTIDHGGSNDTIIFLFFVLHETIFSSLLFAILYRNNNKL